MTYALVTRGYAPSFRSFDRRFERFFNDTTSGLNVEQDDKAFTVSLDIPGVAREDLAVNIEDTVVRIETKAEAKRQFKAAYELPTELDADTSGAKLENGVLTLTLAKKLPVSNVRSLEIK